MPKPKQINEKTFELNITYELLSLSKSFIWYLDHYFFLDFPHPRCRNIISKFLRERTIFASGLTQQEEKENGFDVTINYRHPSGQEGRIMFLQYKAGGKKIIVPKLVLGLTK